MIWHASPHRGDEAKARSVQLSVSMSVLPKRKNGDDMARAINQGSDMTTTKDNIEGWAA